MTLAIEALGEENVDRLKQSVLQLAKEGGDAAPEFQALANEIDRIGKQGQALQAFQELSRETDELREKQLAAAQSAQKLADETDQLWASVQRTRAEQKEATQALVAGRTANVEAGNAIRLLKTEYDAAGKQTQEYRDRLRELTQVQAESRSALVQLGAASSEANKNAREAEIAFGRTQKEYTSAATAADKLSGALREQQSALEQSATAAQDLGVATDDVASAEAELLQTLNAAGKAAKERSESIKGMAEADRLAAIEAESMLELYKRGEDALLSEVLAYREAEQASERYAAAKAKAASDAEAWQREADAIVEAAEAARRLEDQTRQVIEERRALTAQNLADQMREEAAAAEELTARMRVWESAFDDIIRKEEEAAAAAKRLDSAFDSIGIRPAQELVAEIERIRVAMQTVADSGQLTGQQLKMAFASGEAQIAKLERQIRELNGTLTLADKAAGIFKNSMGQIAIGNLVADGIASIIERVKDMGRQFIEVTVTTERLRRALDAIYKDSNLAAQQFDVLRKVSREAGVSVNEIRDSFVRFSASAHSAGIEVGVANDLFRNLTIAGASLGLTSDSVAGALDALAQMASKGVVSMEELRQQLGDRLPGALGLAAKGLGLTEQELIKLVETGKLTTDQFFPAFSRALVQMHGDTNTIVGAWARMKNMLTELAQVTGESEDTLNGMRLAVKAIGTVIGAVSLTLASFVAGLSTAGKAAILLHETLRGNGREAWAWFNEELTKTRDNLAKQSEVLINYVRGVTTASDSVQDHTKALGANTTAILTNAAAQETVAGAVGATGNVYVQTLAKMSQQTTAAEANTVASERLAKAKKLEGDAMIEAARLSGNAAEAAAASARAAEDNVAASEKIVEARRAEVSLTQQAIDVINAEGTRRGGLTSAMKMQIDALDETITKQRASLEESEQATEQLRAQEAAVRVLAKAYDDNSGSVENFRKNMNALKETAESLKRIIDAETQALAALKAAVDAGLVSQEDYLRRMANLEALKKEYTRTTRDAAEAEALFRDAVKDAADAVSRKAAAESATLEVAKATLSVSEAKYKAMAEEAKASGNLQLAAYAEAQARREHIKVMEIELQIQRLKIAAKEKEIEIQLLALKGTDDETRAKREQLEIERELLKAQRELLGVQEAAIASEKAKAQSIEHGTDARKGSNKETRTSIQLLDEETSAIDRSTQAMLRRMNMDKERYSLNTAGERVNMAVPTEKYIFDTAKSQGLSEKDALALTDSLWRGVDSATGRYDASTKTYTDWFSLMNIEINRKVMEIARRNAAAETANTGASTGGHQTPSGASMAVGTTVDIRINGQSSQVGVASQRDAQTLISALRTLENQANTASRT